ncbi:DUF402 domain-containing protein [Peribacillus muralis]|uniref:DUF402 domain-containing protein n=1 Tax=Peribacillus muralis TaxID=264697 RepID=UPI00070B7BA0|nr:DUF402 domain-containing protein [Peribacillus muralis]
MVHINASALRDEIIERKIRYDSLVVEHRCFMLAANEEEAVLFHEVTDSFTINTPKTKLTISKGCYTIAYYWRDRPYNLYIWRNKHGKYVGAYFNIVKNTSLFNNLVTFEDLILDIVVFPDGNYYILDEEELPVPLDLFENGSVQQALSTLLDSLDDLLAQNVLQSEQDYKHESLLSLLGE